MPKDGRALGNQAVSFFSSQISLGKPRPFLSLIDLPFHCEARSIRLLLINLLHTDPKFSTPAYLTPNNRLFSSANQDRHTRPCHHHQHPKQCATLLKRCSRRLEKLEIFSTLKAPYLYIRDIHNAQAIVHGNRITFFERLIMPSLTPGQ